MIKSGRLERVPYSLSRYTDVPASKWVWFQAQLAKGYMLAFDPRNATPGHWSLRPEDTAALVFWTKDPKSLVEGYDRDIRKYGEYDIKAHVTITGWREVEHGVMATDDACRWTEGVASRFGPQNVFWRFSPVPILPDYLGINRPDLGIEGDGWINRFEHIAKRLQGLTTQCYISFLQPNARIPETRTAEERVRILRVLANLAAPYGIEVILCLEDHTPLPSYPNLRAGVCVPPESFRHPTDKVESCGCVPMVDPFTINEACTLSCDYCYTLDTTSNPHKRNTTRLPIVK